MIKKYYARTGAPFKGEHVQQIGEFIEGVENRTTENILNEIRSNPSHVIHDYIEWDDNKAADSYRLGQVRNIVSHVEVKILDVEEKAPVRAFQSVTIENSKVNERVYVPIDYVFDHDFERKQVIGRALVELRNWRERYKIYKELHDVIDKIEPFIKVES